MTNHDKELDKLLAYLEGSSDYDGVWFGEGVPVGKKGSFWWRKELRKLITTDRERAVREAFIAGYGGGFDAVGRFRPEEAYADWSATLSTQEGGKDEL